MSISLFTGIPIWEPVYKPRHKSTRPARNGSGRLAQAERMTSVRRRASRPESQQSSLRLADLVNVSSAPQLLDGLTDRQLRWLLEDCTDNDRVSAVPEIAYLIAHPSHSAKTLALAWDDFRQFTRASQALLAGTRHGWEFFDSGDQRASRADTAAAVMANLADDAWELITSGLPESAKEPAARPVAERVFPGREDQVAEARQFIKRALDGCPVVEDAILCVSELATNALLHSASGNGGHFKITVERGESSVRVAVSDNGSAGKPAIRVLDATSEQGRGLALVELVASQWGESGDERGRSVWFELGWDAAQVKS
jgi:anti-sigma regulatory factor (Ser/Thr protein kinase)